MRAPPQQGSASSPTTVELERSSSVVGEESSSLDEGNRVARSVLFCHPGAAPLTVCTLIHRHERQNAKTNSDFCLFFAVSSLTILVPRVKLRSAARSRGSKCDYEERASERATEDKAVKREAGRPRVFVVSRFNFIFLAIWCWDRMVWLARDDVSQGILLHKWHLEDSAGKPSGHRIK